MPKNEQDKLTQASLKDEKVNIPDTTGGSPKPQGSEGNNSRNKNGFLFTLLALLTALFVIFAVLYGAFYVAIQYNVKGVTDKYKKNIQEIPILNLALPKPINPEDPKYLSQDQIKKKFLEYKKKYEEQSKIVVDLNKKIQELEKIKGQNQKIKADNEKIKKEAQNIKKEADNTLNTFRKEKVQFDELVASKDTASFKAYYEKVDKEVAKASYEKILKEEKATEDAKKFAKLYESMDAANAAAIFEQMGNEKINLIADILKTMKKESASLIIAEMTPKFASKVTEKLSTIYFAKPK